MSKISDLLFFTYADINYQYFALPYAFCALQYNPDAKVEIALEDYNCFMKENNEGVAVIDSLFPGKVLFRQSDIAKSGGVVPNTVRFIEKPLTICRYVYIGDIDLLVLDDVAKIWHRLIREYNLPFGNAKRRSDPKKLSGLHFIEYSKYYPLPDISDLDLSSENDESVLFEIMKRKGLMVPDGFHIRPLCGLHMSLSRDPWGRYTGPSKGEYKTPGLPWMLPEDRDLYIGNFITLLCNPAFLKLYPYFNYKFKCLLLVAEGYAEGKERTLHCFASSYMVDKRLLVNEKNLNIKFAKTYFRKIRRVSYDDATDYLLKLHAIWPMNISIHLMCFNHFLERDPERSVEFALLMTDFSDGFEYWCNYMNINEIRAKLSGTSLAAERLLARFEAFGS